MQGSEDCGKHEQSARKKNMLLLVQFYVILRDVKVLYFKAAVCGRQYSQ